MVRVTFPSFVKLAIHAMLLGAASFGSLHLADPAVSGETADRRRDRPSQATVWVWDCAAAPIWREAIKGGSLHAARATARRLNDRSTVTAKFYVANGGDVPDEVPECAIRSANLAASVRIARKETKESPGRDKGASASPPTNVLDAGGRSSESFDELNTVSSDRRPAESPRKPAKPEIHNKTTLVKAAATASAGDTGQLVLLSGSRHDFGSISPTEAVRHVFEVRNAGRGELSLQLIQKSCGCTSVRIDGQELAFGQTSLANTALEPIPQSIDRAEFPGTPRDSDRGVPSPHETTSSLAVTPATMPRQAAPAKIEPTNPEGGERYRISAGKTAKIEISVDTRDARGQVSQMVIFSTSDPAHSQVDFHVEGAVIPPFELSQRWFNFREIRADQPAQQMIRLTSRIVSDLKIMKIASSDPAIKVRAEPLGSSDLRADGAKSGFAIHVDLAAGQPIGLLEGEISVTTNLPNQPSITVPLLGRVVGDLSLVPGDTLDFGTVPEGASSRLGFYAKIVTAVPINVKVTRVEPEFLQVDLHKPAGLSRNNQFIITEVTLPSTAPKGEFRGVIEFETTHATARRIRIPVFGKVTESELTTVTAR